MDPITRVKDYLLPPDEVISEGEEFIRDFLEEAGLPFEREKVIKGLAGDSKGYRKADFYIPKYKIYIEFLGHWNTSKEHRERYKEKMRVYWTNRIPCVYIYPENLGIIEHSFYRRCREELSAHGMNSELFRFNLSSFWSDVPLELLGLILGSLLLLFSTNTRTEAIVLGAIVLICAVRLWRSWRVNFKPVQRSRS